MFQFCFLLLAIHDQLICCAHIHSLLTVELRCSLYLVRAKLSEESIRTQKQNKQYQNINQKHPKTKDMFRKQTQTSEKQSTRCIAENSVARLKMHVAEQIRQMWQKYVATR